MVTFSLCMIVKNEETNLKNCLDSCFELFDEIVIVDTGSTDSTKKVASKYTDKIYDFKWINDFSAARNYSFSFATMDYIMFLDADDILDKENLDKLKKLKENLISKNVLIALKYNYCDSETFFRERIIPNNGEYHWENFIHEAIFDKDGKECSRINKDITIYHTNRRNGFLEYNKYFYLFENRKLRKKEIYLYGQMLFNMVGKSQTLNILKNDIYTQQLSEEDLIYYNRIYDMISSLK